jgi:hypothetical protein
MIPAGVCWVLQTRRAHPQDAAKPFGFPDTLTAASYVLRRAYAQLLWDFEQVWHNKTKPESSLQLHLAACPEHLPSAVPVLAWHSCWVAM